LLCQSVVSEGREVGDGDVVATFDDGLAGAEECELAVGAVSDSELFGGADDGGADAVSDEHAGFGCGDEDGAVFALIDVDAGCGVEEEDVALFAVGYLELLHLQFGGFADEGIEPPVLE
jgi:hypothetical protein